MKTKTLLSFFFYFGCCALLLAQQDLLDDKNVSWIAEWTTDYNLLDIPEDDAAFMGRSPLATYIVEKMYQAPNAIGFAKGYDAVSPFWKLLLIDWLQYYDLGNAYQDADLSEKVTPDFYQQKLVSLDTVVTFDPLTYFEQLTVVRNEVAPASLVGLRLRHCLYLDQDEVLKYRLLAWTPLLMEEDDLGQPQGVVPTFWFPATEATDPDKLRSSPDVALVVEAKQRNQQLALKKRDDLRGVFDPLSFFSQVFNDTSIPLYSTDGSYYPIAKQERTFLIEGSVDTVTTFSPDTYQEVVQVIKNRPYVESIEEIRLVLRWFWDARSRKLYYEFVGYAPVQSVRDSEGMFKYYRPLVYIKS